MTPHAEQEHSLRVLELPKVLEMVARHAWWERSKQAVMALRPLPSLEAVRRRQAEVAAAMRLDAAFQSPPIRGMRDVVPQADAAARGQVLEPTDLLDVARALEVAMRVRKSLMERDETCPLMS